MPRKPLSTPQLKVLLMRSGQICAFDGCNELLWEEAGDPRDQDTAVFEIAHILAASPGGARYDEDQDDDERVDISNLMLLCVRHHKIIDSQRAAYPAERLFAMKTKHEQAVGRGQRYAMNAVGFIELEAVCSSLRLTIAQAPSTLEPLTLPPGVADKIRINSLGHSSETMIKSGLSKTTAVAEFITFSEKGNPGYSQRLQLWFKAKYAGGILSNLSGDDLFDFIYSEALDNAGVNRNELLEAAAIAVVVHLFEICEIFESADAAS